MNTSQAIDFTSTEDPKTHLREQLANMQGNQIFIGTKCFIYAAAKAFRLEVPTQHEEGQLPDYPAYHYVWGTIEGRATETFMISGPYDQAVMVEIMDKFLDAILSSRTAHLMKRKGSLDCIVHSEHIRTPT